MKIEKTIYRKISGELLHIEPTGAVLTKLEVGDVVDLPSKGPNEVKSITEEQEVRHVDVVAKVPEPVAPVVENTEVEAKPKQKANK